MWSPKGGRSEAGVRPSEGLQRLWNGVGYEGFGLRKGGRSCGKSERLKAWYILSITIGFLELSVLMWLSILVIIWEMSLHMCGGLGGRSVRIR